MMLNDENKKSVNKMMKGRALYIALGVCVLAAGAVGFSSVKNAGTPEAVTPETMTGRTSYSDTERHIYTDPITTVPFEESAFTEDQTEPVTEAVFDSSLKPLEETTQEPETEKPVRYSSPLSLEIGADYSRGVPVFSSTMSDYRTHNGVDFLGVQGDTVKPISEGTVISVTKDAVWGNSVTVDHGNGVVSKICGLADKDLVAEGDYVHENAVIGRVGTVPVEANDSSHIHLEVRRDGNLIDPLELLGFADAEDDVQ